MAGVDHGHKPTRSRSRTLEALIRLVDPGYDQERRKQPEYEFSNGRVFRGDPRIRGPYAPEE